MSNQPVAHLITYMRNVPDFEVREVPREPEDFEDGVLLGDQAEDYDFLSVFGNNDGTLERFVSLTPPIPEGLDAIDVDNLYESDEFDAGMLLSERGGQKWLLSPASKGKHG